MYFKIFLYHTYGQNISRSLYQVFDDSSVKCGRTEQRRNGKFIGCRTFDSKSGHSYAPSSAALEGFQLSTAANQLLWKPTGIAVWAQLAHVSRICVSSPSCLLRACLNSLFDLVRPFCSSSYSSSRLVGKKPCLGPSSILGLASKISTNANARAQEQCVGHDATCHLILHQTRFICARSVRP